MSLDAPLVAAATLRRQGLSDGGAELDDAVHQLQLAHVLLDGGYDGVATIGEALLAGDHGLGTFDRLDGELAVIDGDPWQIDYTGAARVMPPETLTPFAVVTTLESPRTLRLTDATREELIEAVESMVDDAGSIAAVRVEGAFTRVLNRSVPPQTPPYRPYVEVCTSDEVRWELAPFEGVYVGFRFPEISGGDVIAGLHLHGVSSDHSTGGHNHELHVRDAVVSVGTSHEVVLWLPDRGMVDLLETPGPMRLVQRLLLRRGPSTAEQVAKGLHVTLEEAVRRIEWLGDRGFVEELEGGVGGLGGEIRWRMKLAHRATRAGDRPSASLLADL